MSSISMDIPTLQINGDDIHNILCFVSKHEGLLKEFGAIKIQPNIDCKLALKKRRKHLLIYPMNKQILKMGNDKYIYSVEKVNHIRKSPKKSLLIKDEADFWSSLSCLNQEQRLLNISLLPNESFFNQYTPRSYFDIHRLPGQSLLKLGGKKITQQCVPHVKRAHGPGAIFPLSCTQQQLFSIDYHHEGGLHHWYIIPTRERQALQKILDQQNSSTCLDHGQVFINPKILDENRIRYHRIIQKPNEFIVLSAGTLAQSFAEDASWSESIAFALPSWIQDGHASISIPPCQCEIPRNSLSQPIDVNLFRHELIQKYITSYLNNSIHDESIPSTGLNNIDMVTIPTPSSIQTNSSNDESVLPTNMRLIIPRQRVMSPFQSPSISLITPSVSSCLSDDDQKKPDDNNDHMHYNLLEQNNLQGVFDRKIPDINLLDFILSEQRPEPDIQANQPCQTTTASTNICQDFTDKCNEDDYFLPYEELMDFLPSNADSFESTYTQTDEYIHTDGLSTLSFNTHTTAVNKQSHVDDDRIYHGAINDRKTLFVSGFRNDLNKNDLRMHFTGCIKVTIKRYRAAPHQKYAFVLHRTSREAEYNLRRPVDLNRLGPECNITYATGYPSLDPERRSLDTKKIMVRYIPQNATENDLRRLFGHCHIIKYCPAITVPAVSTTKYTIKKPRFLPGYAYILFDNEQQATYAIEHTNQYQINGQSLAVCLYRN